MQLDYKTVRIFSFLEKKLRIRSARLNTFVQLYKTVILSITPF